MAEVMRYAEMKDSGVEWLGEIPSRWKVLRGKTILTLLERPVLDDDDVVTCFRDGEVTLRKNRREEGFTNSLKEIGYQGIEPGDLVVHGMDGFAGAIGISDSRGKASPVLNVMDSSQNKKFIMYYLRALAYKDVFMGLSTGIRVRSCDLRWNKLSNLPFLIPSCDEQKSAVAYLDNQCAQIDDIIASAKASIEEYKAWKASVIYEVVTKGLDVSVEMKDSGVESLGEIPADWNLVRLKFLLEAIVDCPHETPNYNEDGPYFVIRTADQDVGFLRSDDKMYRLNEQEYLSRIRRMSLEKGDIVYGREGERWGLACLIPESNKYCLGQRMMHFRCDSSKILPEFALWALNSQGTYTQGIMDTLGSTSPHVNISTIKNFALAVPSLEKQREIVSFLTDKNEQIQKVIEEKEALIANLESYKKSLIYEVVTGKRKVA